MGKQSAITLASSVVILGAVTFLVWRFYGVSPGLEGRPHRALGMVMAEEALKLAGSGGHITVITRDTSLYLNPAADEQLKSFTDTLTRKGAKVFFTHRLRVDPLRVVSVPPGDFQQILKKAEEADVVVSFLGPPILGDEQLASLRGKNLKVLAVCSGNMPRQINLKRIFDEGLLKGAVVSKASATAAGPGSGDLQAWFNHFFTLVTSANLGDLSAAR